MIRLKNKIVNSDISVELYNKLKNICNSENWILGTMFNLSDLQKLELINIINSGENNRNNLSIKALEFRGIVGTPIEEFDGNPEDIINWDDDDK